MISVKQPILEHKLGISKLAEELGNLSRACEITGSSMETFHHYYHAPNSGGVEALLRNNKYSEYIKNAEHDAIEQTILEYAYKLPAFGNVCVSNELRKLNIFVSPGTVKSIWRRHDIESFEQRMGAIEKSMAAAGKALTEMQLAALARNREDDYDSDEIGIPHPGYLGLQDTFYVGTLIDVGRIYQQIFIDVFSNVAFAKIYTTKMPITAADLFNDRVLPFYARHHIAMRRILTESDAEFLGRLEDNEYQLYLAVNGIQHTKVKTASREISCACERLHQKIQLELHDVALRRNVYQSLERLQVDLDSWLHRYNNEQPHSGDICKGRTPMKTFLDGKKLVR